MQKVREMVWPFGHFWTFLNVHYKVYFGKRRATKLAIVYEILTLNLVILTFFKRKLGLYLGFISFLRLWPYSAEDKL